MPEWQLAGLADLLVAGGVLLGMAWALVRWILAPRLRTAVRDAVRTEITAVRSLASSVDALNLTVGEMRTDYRDLSSGMRSLGDSVDRLREATNAEIAALRERMTAQETLATVFGRRETDRLSAEGDDQ